MGKTTVRLTVFFENPFWVGVVERAWDGKLSAAKVFFGAEPKDYEVYDFVLNEYYHLKFSPAVANAVRGTKKNPKRIQRDVKRQLEHTGVGTKSQQALKLQHEQVKTERKQIRKEMREAEKQRLFERKQQKRREKHKGH